MDTNQNSGAARDPVCGMTVDPAKAKGNVEYGGATYYFCCTGCAQKFQAAPEQYLKAEPAGLVTLGTSQPTKHSSAMVGLRRLQRRPQPELDRHRAVLRLLTFVQCVPRCESPSPCPARAVGWRWNPKAPCC